METISAKGTFPTDNSSSTRSLSLVKNLRQTPQLELMLLGTGSRRTFMPAFLQLFSACIAWLELSNNTTQYSPALEVSSIFFVMRRLQCQRPRLSRCRFLLRLRNSSGRSERRLSETCREFGARRGRNAIPSGIKRRTHRRA